MLSFAIFNKYTCFLRLFLKLVYFSETPEVITTHAFDLSKHNFPAYEADLKKQRCEDHALSVTGKASQMYRLYGKVARCKGRNLFVDELMHPVWQK